MTQSENSGKWNFPVSNIALSLLFSPSKMPACSRKPQLGTRLVLIGEKNPTINGVTVFVILLSCIML